MSHVSILPFLLFMPYSIYFSYKINRGTYILNHAFPRLCRMGREEKVGEIQDCGFQESPKERAQMVDLIGKVNIVGGGGEEAVTGDSGASRTISGNVSLFKPAHCIPSMPIFLPPTPKRSMAC